MCVLLSQPQALTPALLSAPATRPWELTPCPVPTPGKAWQCFGGISHLPAVDVNACCLSQFIECTRRHTHKRATSPTYLPSPDIDVGKRVLPPVLLKRLLLLTLDGLGIIVLINPLLRPRKGVCFRKYHNYSKFPMTLSEQCHYPDT